MKAILQFISDHQLALYMLFSAIVSSLPSPLQGERWYGAIYNLLHLGASNVAKVFPALRVGQKEQ